MKVIKYLFLILIIYVLVVAIYSYQDARSLTDIINRIGEIIIRPLKYFINWVMYLVNRINISY